MRIQATGLVNSLRETSLIGQILQVKVLKTADNPRLGTITLAGQQLQASFETAVKSGDRFLVSVKEVNEDLIVLSKLDPKVDLNLFTSKGLALIQQRGYVIDPTVSELLDKFTGNLFEQLSLFSKKDVQSTSHVTSILEQLFTMVPEWSTLSGRRWNAIFQYLIFLGLHYEKRLKDMVTIKGELSKHPEQIELKSQVLKQLWDGQMTKEEEQTLKALLDQITGQQLWAQSGNKKNAYILLHIPLRDQGEIYQAAIAFESPRKGNRLDSDRCHIALKVETPSLGFVGADIWFFEDQLDLTLLNDNPNHIQDYLHNNEAAIKQAFLLSEIILKDIKVCTFRDKPQFDLLISGYPSEVDTLG